MSRRGESGLGKAGGSGRGECGGVVVCWYVESIVKEDAELEELVVEYEDVEANSEKGGWGANGLPVNLILAIIRSMGHKSL